MDDGGDNDDDGGNYEKQGGDDDDDDDTDDKQANGSFSLEMGIGRKQQQPIPPLSFSSKQSWNKILRG